MSTSKKNKRQQQSKEDRLFFHVWAVSGFVPLERLFNFLPENRKDKKQDEQPDQRKEGKTCLPENLPTLPACLLSCLPAYIPTLCPTCLPFDLCGQYGANKRATKQGKKFFAINISLTTSNLFFALPLRQQSSRKAARDLPKGARA